jgi:hypothetical protein
MKFSLTVRKSVELNGRMIPTFSVSECSVAINACPLSPNWKSQKDNFDFFFILSYGFGFNLAFYFQIINLCSCYCNSKLYIYVWEISTWEFLPQPKKIDLEITGLFFQE